MLLLLSKDSKTHRLNAALGSARSLLSTPCELEPGQALVPGDDENKGLEAGVPAAHGACWGSDAGSEACCLCRGCILAPCAAGGWLAGHAAPRDTAAWAVKLLETC